ncbi:MAG: hypothetical protein JO151_08005 [Verrucomicrobia bacterium]|nr:hypothetical protein [Verrucomicrobiota bacterium]
MAVAVLETPLIIVLGHTKCGAVDSAVKAVKDGKEYPGHISSLIDEIRPAVKAAQDQAGDLLENAIKQNIVLNIRAGCMTFGIKVMTPTTFGLCQCDCPELQELFPRK